jgi:hypothetical protein
MKIRSAFPINKPLFWIWFTTIQVTIGGLYGGGVDRRINSAD